MKSQRQTPGPKPKVPLESLSAEERQRLAQRREKNKQSARKRRLRQANEKKRLEQNHKEMLSNMRQLEGLREKLENLNAQIALAFNNHACNLVAPPTCYTNHSETQNVQFPQHPHPHHHIAQASFSAGAQPSPPPYFNPADNSNMYPVQPVQPSPIRPTYIHLQYHPQQQHQIPYLFGSNCWVPAAANTLVTPQNTETSALTNNVLISNYFTEDFNTNSNDQTQDHYWPSERW